MGWLLEIVVGGTSEHRGAWETTCSVAAVSRDRSAQGKNASNQFLILQMIEHTCIQSCDDFTSDFKIICEIKTLIRGLFLLCRSRSLRTVPDHPGHVRGR